MTENSERPFDTAAHFDGKRAAVYDDLIRQVIPGYDVLHRLIRLQLHAGLGDEARILAVGAGTGMEIATLAPGRPGWRFSAVDPASEMLEAARRRLERDGLGECTAFHHGFVADLPQEKSFDAACLVLVMHFVPDDGSKAALLGDIARRLKPGAPLILADAHGEKESRGFLHLIDVWRNWQLDAGIKPEDVEKGFRRVVKDIHFVPEERIVGLLSDAGFTTPQPFFASLPFGAWIAWKGQGT